MRLFTVEGPGQALAEAFRPLPSGPCGAEAACTVEGPLGTQTAGQSFYVAPKACRMLDGGGEGCRKDSVGQEDSR